MTRQEIYRGFLDTFATGKYPFEASIENDKLVLYWLWQDILSYGVIRHTEAFKCEVELFDDGTYKRHDMILTGTAGLPTGGAKGRHIDKAQKSLCLGKNLLTGESDLSGEVHKCPLK